MDFDFGTELAKLDLADDIKTKVTGLYDLGVTGLKDKNSDLVERNRTSKEGLEAANLQRVTDAEDAKVKIAEASGNIDQYKQAMTDKTKALEDMTAKNMELTNKGLKDAELAKFMPSISDDPAHREFMQNKFSGAFSIQNGVATPNDVSLTMAQMGDNFLKDPAHASYVKADVGSGGNTVTAPNGTGTAKPFKDMSWTEKSAMANENEAAYKAATGNK